MVKYEDIIKTGQHSGGSMRYRLGPGDFRVFGAVYDGSAAVFTFTAPKSEGVFLVLFDIVCAAVMRIYVILMRPLSAGAKSGWMHPAMKRAMPSTEAYIRTGLTGRSPFAA